MLRSAIANLGCQLISDALTRRIFWRFHLGRALLMLSGAEPRLQKAHVFRQICTRLWIRFLIRFERIWFGVPIHVLGKLGIAWTLFILWCRGYSIAEVQELYRFVKAEQEVDEIRQWAALCNEKAGNLSRQEESPEKESE